MDNAKSGVKLDGGVECANKAALKEHTVTDAIKLVACVLVETTAAQRLMDIASLVVKLEGGEKHANMVCHIHLNNV
ncbi:hypothetical protein CHS0354_040089 [Potamilus streckersoni]|uniref:Uncharacterized protein n=1 Tax=Potamilus streckersoni TaxID=2493646 RepID=A0AAE0SUC4_9BIVA|nr:hypothetical protein CHS0354_040089 [Potamilus streckersoni]